MLSTASASSSAEGELGSCPSAVAVLLLSRVIQLLVRHKRLVVLRQSLVSCLNGREVLILLRIPVLALIVLLQELDLRELRAAVRREHAHVRRLHALVGDCAGATVGVEAHEVL